MQLAALAGHAVVYMIGPIFKHIIDYLQLHLTNGYCALTRQLSLPCRRDK